MDQHEIEQNDPRRSSREMIWVRAANDIRHSLILRLAIEPDFGPAFAPWKSAVRGGGCRTSIAAIVRESHRPRSPIARAAPLYASETIENPLPAPMAFFRLLDSYRHFGDEFNRAFGIVIARWRLRNAPLFCDDSVGRIILRRGSESARYCPKCLDDRHVMIIVV